MFVDHDGSISKTLQWNSFSSSTLDVVCVALFQTIVVLFNTCLFKKNIALINIIVLIFSILKIIQFDPLDRSGTMISLIVFVAVAVLHLAFSMFDIDAANSPSRHEKSELYSSLLPSSSDPKVHYNARPNIGKDVTCCKQTCRTVGLILMLLISLALSPLFLVIFLFKTILGCCCKGSAKSKRERDFESLQTEHPSFPTGIIGSGAPILKGVRVIELATVVAGPSAGRILADHGAEVIRVEPPSGDMWRNYLKILESHRKTFTSTFEHTSFNKSCVVLDLNQEPDIVKMKQLMNKADIFITNVRLPALQKLGLDYSSIKNEMPHLVYGHISAWGLVGPAKSDPGYDFGAFWSQTGMAALSNSAGHYAQYPGAFGDTIAGSNLVSGMISGLRQRFTNGGIGCYLETSLLRAGMWIMAPHLSRCCSNTSNESETKSETKSNNTVTKYRQHDDRSHCTGTLSQDVLEMNDVFVSLDNKRFVLEELHSNVDIMRAKYKEIMKITKNNSIRLFASKTEYNKLKDLLKDVAALHRISPELNGAPSLDNTLYLDTSKSLVRTDITPDNKLWVRSPFDFSCSNQHNIIKRRAPELGEHTKSIFENGKGFVHRDHNDSSIVPRIQTSLINDIESASSNASSPCIQPMSDVLIVEIPAIGTSVSAATALCADEGADVYQLLINGVHPMNNIDPYFVRQFRRTKKILSIQNYQNDVIPEIQKLIQTYPNKYVVIVHNLSTCRSMDAIEFSKPNGKLSTFYEKHPNIIVVDVSSCGVHPSILKNETRSSDLGCFFADGFLSHVLGDGANLEIAPMFQFGEMITSIHIKTAIDLALFHLIRTDIMMKKPEGNLVELNLTRCGIYSNLMFIGMNQVS